jgi:hypothetical protein
MRITVDIPDDLAAECERRAPNTTWNQLITDALVYALAQADTEHPTPNNPTTSEPDGHLLLPILNFRDRAR